MYQQRNSKKLYSLSITHFQSRLPLLQLSWMISFFIFTSRTYSKLWSMPSYQTNTVWHFSKDQLRLYLIRILIFLLFLRLLTDLSCLDQFFYFHYQESMLCYKRLRFHLYQNLTSKFLNMNLIGANIRLWESKFFCIIEQIRVGG